MWDVRPVKTFWKGCLYSALTLVVAVVLLRTGIGPRSMHQPMPWADVLRFLPYVSLGCIAFGFSVALQPWFDKKHRERERGR